MPILTIVTPEPRPDFDLWIKKSHPEIRIEERAVLSQRAVRWEISDNISKENMDQIRKEFRIDLFLTQNEPDIRLFIADMDSTIVSGETLDDMAELVGIGSQVASITERAMQGELDFEAALRERVKMLKGCPASLINKAVNNLKLNNGAVELLSHLKDKNVYCVLISGGFTQFTSVIAEKLGFDAHFGNELLISPKISTGELPFFGQTGPLIPNPNDLIIMGEVGTPIIDKQFKRNKLQELQSAMNLQHDQIIAIGDGANDLPMLQSTELGIAYHGKELLKNNLINRIDYTDLSAVTYLV